MLFVIALVAAVWVAACFFAVCICMTAKRSEALRAPRRSPARRGAVRDRRSNIAA